MNVNQPHKQLGFLLMQSSLLKQRIINTALRDLEITYMQFVVLAGILEIGDTQTNVKQQDLATQRQLDKAMVSNVVNSLVKRNLIVKETHPSDHRASILSLSQRGKELAIKGKIIALDIDKFFFADIESESLREMLEILISTNSVVK